MREIQLPLVVEENLQQVLSYELDRYTPFVKDEAHVGFEIVARNSEANTVTLLFAAVEKARPPTLPQTSDSSWRHANLD